MSDRLLLPVIDLIRSRMMALGLDRGAVVARAGYANPSKGLRRFDALMDGDLTDQPFLFERLPGVLDASNAQFVQAVVESRRLDARREEDARRRAFAPHAVILTERSAPSSVTMAILSGSARSLTIELDTSKPPVTFAMQVVATLRMRVQADGQVPFFGQTTGFAVNLAPDAAVLHDLDGNPVKTLDRAVTRGGSLAVRRRPLPRLFFAGS